MIRWFIEKATRKGRERERMHFLLYNHIAIKSLWVSQESITSDKASAKNMHKCGLIKIGKSTLRMNGTYCCLEIVHWIKLTIFSLFKLKNALKLRRSLTHICFLVQATSSIICVAFSCNALLNRAPIQSWITFVHERDHMLLYVLYYLRQRKKNNRDFDFTLTYFDRNESYARWRRQQMPFKESPSATRKLYSSWRVLFRKWQQKVYMRSDTKTCTAAHTHTQKKKFCVARHKRKTKLH